MFDFQVDQEAQIQLKKHRKDRIFSFTFQNQKYFVKQPISNGRNRLVKMNPKQAFHQEAFKIFMINHRYNLAAPIVSAGNDYIVMKDCGLTLQHILEDCTDINYLCIIFKNLGYNLSTLHKDNIIHGRPALRDIIYDQESQHVRFLDLENDYDTKILDKRCIDLLLFFHGYFREAIPKNFVLDAFLNGYLIIEGGQERILALKHFLHKHNKIYLLTKWLESFHFVDVEALERCYEYFSKKQIKKTD